MLSGSMKTLTTTAAAPPTDYSSEVSISLLPCSSSSSSSPSSCNSFLSAECRICQEEDIIQDLEKPCACSGSIKYAHRACVQRWCNEKGNTICEICKQPYTNGYTSLPSPIAITTDDISIDFSGDEWEALEFHDGHRLLAIQQQFLDAHYEEANSTSVACCRSIALVLVALLLLRHGIAMASVSASNQEDASMFFTLFVLRAVGFVLPCYIMVRAMNMLQRSRLRQEETMAGVAFVLQAGSSRRYISLNHFPQPQQSRSLSEL